jgi:type I restriction enzyme S subunit
MKDSGIEWIGEIPEEWNLERAKYYFIQSFEKGNNELRLLSATQADGVIPKENLEGVVQVKEDTDLSTFKTVHCGDFVISLRSFQGGFEMSEYEGVITPAYSVFRAKIAIDRQYYKKFFKCDGFIAKMNSLTVGIREGKNIMFSDFANTTIPIPSIYEQTSIANYLDTRCTLIDQTIEKQKKVIVKLKEYKQSVITEAVTKGLNPNVPMKDSGIEWIGEIPEHWECTKIGNIFSFIGGYAFESSQFVKEGINQVLRIGNIKNEGLLLRANPVYIDDKYAEMQSQFIVKTDDILFSMTGTKGKRDYFYTTIIEESDKYNNLFINQRVGCFRKKVDIIAKYYGYLFKTDRIKDSIFLYETGTANQGNLGIETIRRTVVQFPPREEQENICGFLDECTSNTNSIIEKKEQVIEKLESYKKSLIYECVTGKREVNNV